MFGQRLYKQAIQRCLNTGSSRIAIYPYGRRGREIRNTLKEYFDLEPVFIVDNNLCNKCDNILSIDQFCQVYSKDICVILTVQNEKINAELDKSIKEFIDEDRIINLLSLDDEREKIDDSLAGVKTFVTHGYTRENEYEQRWQKIKTEYKVVKIYKFDIDAIGEMLPRSFVMEENKKDDELFVALPSVGSERNKIVNNYAYQYIGMPGLDDILFWLYVIREHQAEVDVSDMEWYMKRIHFDNIFIKAYSVKPHFTEDEVREGEKRLREMGVNGKFVSMAARTSQYNSRTLIDGWDESFYDYRNADFQDYRDTIDYLSTIRLQAVKAGSYEDVMNPIDNCIDYAGRFSTDFMDLFLPSRCEFMITGASGIFCLAQLFAKPILMVNTIPISWGMGGAMRYTEYDMYIPKKIYDKKAKRYLTFKEIYALEQECRIDTLFYEENNLEIVNNSSQEILEATQEMIARIEGTWVDTEEDNKNYAKYEKLHNKMRDRQMRNPKNWIGKQPPYRLATTFIRKNLFMLNDGE